MILGQDTETSGLQIYKLSHLKYLLTTVNHFSMIPLKIVHRFLAWTSTVAKTQADSLCAASSSSLTNLSSLDNSRTF